MLPSCSTCLGPSAESGRIIHPRSPLRAIPEPLQRCNLCTRLTHDARPCKASIRAQAGSSGSPDTPPDALTAEEARSILGLQQDATFEQTVQAKNKLLGQAENDSQKQLRVEMAYDILLMRSMKARISGELQPAKDVRFADVPKYRPAAPRGKTWQEKVLEKLPGRVRVEAAPQDSAAIQGIIFGTLAASAILQELFLKTAPDSGNAPSLQLGLAFGASIYFLRDGKRLSLELA